MIIVKLMGGLGNQMFQYAYALNLGKKYGEEILFDTSFYLNKKQIDLYNFSVSKHQDWREIIPENERSRVVKAQKEYRVLQKTKRVLLRTEELGHNWFYRNIRKGYYFNFDQYFYPFIETAQANKYIYGYFQSEKYFYECRDYVFSEFSLEKPLGTKAKGYLDLICSSNSVALHIRLGDYKEKKNYYLDVCTPKYYMDSMNYVLEHVETPRFFVFTNDASGVKGLIDLPKDSIIVEGTRDFEDFELMRNCKHLVLSNSTFSWWASYLNYRRELVVVPTPWFKTLKRDSDIYLPEMKRIQV